MASLLPDFEYDVFISYRQNDNKYDGWVTEFVDNLNKEVEATIKDKVHIYFDANPHDGLLETHSVSHSLEAKLKCLVFIPILSKTYCDTKGFAWNHEFLAFIDKAKEDQFGLNIKLASGNVSSRVLPVRIHDLDPDDIKLAETFIGPIRSVDFIYHSPGVNRSLRPWDDDIIKNTKQPYYRDQINKVANAIDDIIRGIKQAEKNKSAAKNLPVTGFENNPPAEKVLRPGKKSVQSGSYSRVLSWASFIIVLGVAAFFGTHWYMNQQNVARAKLVLLPAIQKLLDENFRPPMQAYELGLEAKKYIPNDSTFLKMWPRLTWDIPFETNPAGAEIYWKPYNMPERDWIFAGTSPAKDLLLLKNYVRIEVRKPGFQTIMYSSRDHFFL